MKTLPVLIVLMFTLLLSGERMHLSANQLTDNIGLDVKFSASEIHPDEILLRWSTSFPNDDFESIQVLQSTNGADFQVISDEEIHPVSDYPWQNLIVKADGSKEMTYRLTAQTPNGTTVVLKTLTLALGKPKLEAIPLKSNDVIYLSASKQGQALIVDTDGNELARVEVLQSLQPLDISHLSRGIYYVQSGDPDDNTSVSIERL